MSEESRTRDCRKSTWVFEVYAGFLGASRQRQARQKLLSEVHEGTKNARLVHLAASGQSKSLAWPADLGQRMHGAALVVSLDDGLAGTKQGDLVEYAIHEWRSLS